MFGFKYIPAPSGLNSSSMSVLGIFAGSLILWLFVSIDWPSLLAIFALGFVESLNLKTILAGAFGSDIFLFLLFTFVCTYSLSKTSLIKRISIWFITNKFAQKSGWSFVILFLFSTLLIGSFVSPSVLFVILLPIVNEIYKIAKIEKGEKSGALLMIGLAFTISISSGMTPIAHVFPIIAMSNYATFTG